MDLLIYNKDHWMDVGDAYVKAMLAIESDKTLTPEQILKKKEILAQKYAARYRRGDIVEVAEDGRYANQMNPAFKVVHLPGIKPDYSLMKSQFDGEKIVKVRQYAVDATLADQVNVTKIADASLVDKSVVERVVAIG